MEVIGEYSIPLEERAKVFFTCVETCALTGRTAC